jgi:hypothetical protein
MVDFEESRLNVGVHGVNVDLHLERLWSQNITITTRLSIRSPRPCCSIAAITFLEVCCDERVMDFVRRPRPLQIG